MLRRKQGNHGFGIKAENRAAAGTVGIGTGAEKGTDVGERKALPDLRERLLSQQYEPLGGSSERFAKLIREDMERYAKVIRESGIKPD